MDEDEVKWLMHCDYERFLESWYWYIVRAYVVNKAKYRCSICERSGRQYHVHHLNYEHRGFELYHLEDLMVLCEDCHEQIHMNKLKRDPYEEE